MNIDNDKIIKVLDILNNYYKDSNGLAEISYPDILEYKSKEWIYYMFYSCLLDYGMRSKIYHQNLINTYNNFPYIFNPFYVVKLDRNELAGIVKDNIHPRYPNVAVDKWIKLSTALVEYDDIVSTLNSMTSFDDLSKFVRGINGYGQKTGGLLIRVLTDASLCNLDDSILAIPLDRHDIEISYLNSIIDIERINGKEIDILSNAFILGGKKLGICASDVDKYLWEIGNSFCNKKKCIECPLSTTCKRK